VRGGAGAGDGPRLRQARARRQGQAIALATCRRLAKRIDAAAPEGARAALPRCGDPDDQKFLEAALAADAQFLITKDRKLLALSRKKGIQFRIVRPEEFGKG
jgi:predicted nucleic acid-binding protein